MRAFLCVVVLAACKHAAAPRPIETASRPSPGSSATAVPDASVDAAPVDACLGQDPCSHPCVSIDGRRVELPPVAMAVVHDVPADYDTGAFTTFTINLFDDGDADCARRDYGALLSTTDGRLGFQIGTISWGGMMQATDIQLHGRSGGRMDLCVSPTTLHMDGKPTIVVSGMFSAPICPVP